MIAAGKELHEVLYNLWRLTDIFFRIKHDFWTNDYKNLHFAYDLRLKIVAGAFKHLIFYLNLLSMLYSPVPTQNPSLRSEVAEDIIQTQ
jgi:hypothetical protein